MIIFLYGLDTYRSRQKLNEIVKHYKKIHKSGLNLKFFDLAEIDFSELKKEISSVSMFSEKKLLILKNPFLKKEFENNFLENKEFFLDSKEVILFYEEGEINLKSPLFKFLKKFGKCQEFFSLKGEKLKNWIKNEFKKYQTKIDPGALTKLINFVGDDLWQMSNEVKKLVSFRKDKRIGKEDVELLVRPRIETDIFETIDALAEKDKNKALFLVQRHLEKGDSPSYIFSMINFQFRNLLMIKDLIKKGENLIKIEREIDLHPYLIKKSYFQAKKFKFEELKKIYQKIFEVDLAIKTGKIRPEAAIEILIAEI